jgi:hypothetical protein
MKETSKPNIAEIVRTAFLLEVEGKAHYYDIPANVFISAGTRAVCGAIKQIDSPFQTEEDRNLPCCDRCLAIMRARNPYDPHY